MSLTNEELVTELEHLRNSITKLNRKYTQLKDFWLTQWNQTSDIDAHTRLSIYNEMFEDLEEL